MALVAAHFPSTGFAATIIVSPGQTIASGIAAAAPGDEVIVRAGTYLGEVTVTKSIAVKADPGVIVRPAGIPGDESAINIHASDCSVEGFLFEDFDWAVDQDTHDRARVEIKYCTFRRSGTVWIDGESWLLEGCEVDRPNVSGLPAAVEDYMNLWGDNHIVRRCYFHGLNLSSDPPQGAHNDAIQTFTEGSRSWQRLRNLIVEECIFADYMQAIWISNVDEVPGAIENIVVRNNVFWGQSYVSGSTPVWSPHGVMFLGHLQGIQIENNVFHHMWNNISLYSMDAVFIQGNIFDNSGNVYSRQDGTPFSAIDRGAQGNIIWNSTFWDSPLAPDKNLNPQLQNPNATIGSEVIGPDGVPWTDDDAWRTLNPATATYGPQLSGENRLPPPWIDTDGDGFSDTAEIAAGTDPNDALSFPALPALAAPSVTGTVFGALILALGGALMLRRRGRSAPRG